MKRETLVIRPEKQKRRIGVLPTYAQRDRTKYTRKAKHRGQNGSAGEQHGKRRAFHVVFASHAGLAQWQSDYLVSNGSAVLRSGTNSLLPGENHATL